MKIGNVELGKKETYFIGDQTIEIYFYKGDKEKGWVFTINDFIGPLVKGNKKDLYEKISEYLRKKSEQKYEKAELIKNNASELELIASIIGKKGNLKEASRHYQNLKNKTRAQN